MLHEAKETILSQLHILLLFKPAFPLQIAYGTYVYYLRPSGKGQKLLAGSFARKNNDAEDADAAKCRWCPRGATAKLLVNRPAGGEREL